LDLNKRLFTSYLGLGWLPVAPGTWASLLPAIVFALLCYFGVRSIYISIILCVLALDAATICVWFSPAVVAELGNEDPREIVVDEVAGQAIAYLGAYAVGGREIFVTAAVGFGAFRLFDIFKPWPCRQLEKLPAGWGILADDLMAGVYAAAVLQICARLWIGNLV
jgi:phosphatidylglycerophosphatase A